MSKRRRENLFEHLRGLGVGIEVPTISQNNSPAWLGKFAVENHLNATQRQSVLTSTVSCRPVRRAGATWFVADLEIPNP